MNEETDNERVEEKAAEAEGPLAGERLAIARRKQQISILEVAKELHLDEHKVRALEQNDFEVLGAPVFAKGHLRKYAQLVGVSHEDLLAEYYMLTRSTGMPPVVGRVRKPAREFSPGPWIAAVVVLLVAAAAYWWFVVRDVPVEIGNQLPAPVELPADAGSESAGDVERPDDSMASVPSDGGNIAEPSIEQADVEAVLLDDTQTETRTPSPPAAGDVRLALTFSGECWTEITDASGRRLFFDLGRPGRAVTVEGRAPLSVLFGNADNVTLQVNGTDRPITAADRRGQTARFTIPAP